MPTGMEQTLYSNTKEGRSVATKGGKGGDHKGRQVRTFGYTRG